MEPRVIKEWAYIEILKLKRSNLIRYSILSIFLGFILIVVFKDLSFEKDFNNWVFITAIDSSQVFYFNSSSKTVGIFYLIIISILSSFIIGNEYNSDTLKQLKWLPINFAHYIFFKSAIITFISFFSLVLLFLIVLLNWLIIKDVYNISLSESLLLQLAIRCLQILLLSIPLVLLSIFIAIKAKKSFSISIISLLVGLFMIAIPFHPYSNIYYCFSTFARSEIFGGHNVYYSTAAFSVFAIYILYRKTI